MENIMENSVAQTSGLVRDIDTVTTEIRNICSQAQSMALMYAIEIGRRLREAKELLPHGEWGGWLKEQVKFSQSSANNFMRIFDEYGDRQLTLFGASANSQTLGNLPYTKALRLIAIPEDEREEFVKDNHIEDMSTRELDAIIRERDQAQEQARKALEAAEEAEAARNMAEQKLSETISAEEELTKLRATLSRIKDEKKETEEKLKNALDNPEISQDMAERFKNEAKKAAEEEAEKAVKDKIEKVQKRLEKAKEEKESVMMRLDEANRRADAYQKAIKTANPEVTAFKTLFEQVQQLYFKMDACLEKIRAEDTDTADRLTKAMKALAERYTGE